jgi:SAM-dependent methyltransferase
MLALSQAINPECEHVLGDMRTLRLEREFDAVFIHDAISYMTTEDDLRQAMQTAYRHCRPGGVALFAPDHVRENFQPSTDHGGHDGGERAQRYLEWTHAPLRSTGHARAADLNPASYVVDYAYLLYETGQPVKCVYDQHQCGLFSRADWLRLLAEDGFRASVVPFQHSEVDYELEVFVAVKPT